MGRLLFCGEGGAGRYRSCHRPRHNQDRDHPSSRFLID